MSPSLIVMGDFYSGFDFSSPAGFADSIGRQNQVRAMYDDIFGTGESTIKAVGENFIRWSTVLMVVPSLEVLYGFPTLISVTEFERTPQPNLVRFAHTTFKLNRQLVATTVIVGDDDELLMAYGPDRCLAWSSKDMEVIASSMYKEYRRVCVDNPWMVSRHDQCSKVFGILNAIVPEWAEVAR